MQRNGTHFEAIEESERRIHFIISLLLERKGRSQGGQPHHVCVMCAKFILLKNALVSNYGIQQNA